MLAARRPLPLVLNRELFGVWFFKINLTVGQFWAKKEEILHAYSRSKNMDPAASPDVPGRATQAGRDPSLLLTRRSTGRHSLAKHNSLK